MSIAVLFTPSSPMSEPQYREILRRLEATGLGAPHGREYHVCFGDRNNLRVVDIFESRETLQTFAASLVPIVIEAGSNPGQPDVLEVLNVIEGPRNAVSSDLAERNKAVARRYVAGVYNEHDLSVVDELVSPSYVDRDPEIRDLAGLRAFTAAVLAAFPDIQTTIDFQMADGDRVVTAWTTQGTQKGEFMGIPATGRSARVSGVTIDRVVNGRIVEQQNVWDRADLMRQLGVLAGAEQPAHA
jgi:steroid delta-isomerase-like uncharacterized protein